MRKMDNLYLGQILKRDKVTYGKNNLILSPTGSGKSHFIMNILSEKYEGKKLMLVSTTSLKDSVLKYDKILSTKDLRQWNYDLNPEVYHVMTYAEFGRRMAPRDKFIEDYSVIFCDEIHSLFDFSSINNSAFLLIAINFLFSGRSEIDTFHFTATIDEMNRYRDTSDKELYDYVNVIDYLNNPDIVRYKVDKVQEFSSMCELEKIIDNLDKVEIKGGLHDLSGAKGLAFSGRISGMKKLEDMLESKGHKAICIWSINNEDVKMNEEQLRVRSILLNDGVIPDDYNYIIINEAMREGWNLIDIEVDVTLIYSKKPTNITQAIGRARKDTKLSIILTDGEDLSTEEVIMNRVNSSDVIEDTLDELIGKSEKDSICETLNIRRKNGRLVKWPTIMKTLIANGYIIKDSRRTVNGVRGTYTIITKASTPSSTYPESIHPVTVFTRKLDRLGFKKVNSDFLANYIGLGKNIAYKHIIGSYERLVVKEGWSERKFTDVTYLLANNKSSFSKDNYTDYGSRYVNTDDDLMLKIRSKYEAEAKSQIDVKNEQKLASKKLEEDELLEYIANNGGKFDGLETT